MALSFPSGPFSLLTYCHTKKNDLTRKYLHSYSVEKWEIVGESGFFMIRGASKIALDAKGRMAIPSRYRDAVTSRGGGKLVATVDRECLLIYPEPDWEEFERDLMAVPNVNPVARRLQQIMMGYATDIRMDAHGRVLIPKELRDVAGLDRRAMLLGQGNKFELWDEDRWNTKRDEWFAADPGEGLSLPAELGTLTF